MLKVRFYMRHTYCSQLPNCCEHNSYFGIHLSTGTSELFQEFKIQTQSLEQLQGLKKKKNTKTKTTKNPQQQGNPHTSPNEFLSPFCSVRAAPKGKDLHYIPSDNVKHQTGFSRSLACRRMTSWWTDALGCELQWLHQSLPSTRGCPFQLTLYRPLCCSPSLITWKPKLSPLTPIAVWVKHIQIRMHKTYRC